MIAKAVIVAAGVGRRVGREVPKQFLPLGGIPLLVWSTQAALRSQAEGIVVVLPEEWLEEGRALLARFVDPERMPAVVAGGVERQDSVRAGAVAAGACDVLVVHDAARPFADAALFDAVAAAGFSAGAAVAAIAAADTVKEVSGETVLRTLERDRLRLAQTPQAFRPGELIEVLDRARAEGIVATDEAALFERFGRSVRTVPGSRRNFKVTDPADFELASRLAGTVPERRVGIGEDVHRLVPNRPLVLGGVTVPFDRGLEGHSDADVVAHALIDALCGAAGLPNVGQMFPDTDPRWQGASSLDLLARAASALREAGWEPVNADCVVLCDRPRISPHATAMREALGGACGVAPERISIKGKSAEGLGPEGRGEGISARVVAMVERTGD